MSGDAMECLNGQKSEVVQVSDQFPVGLRVLVVDDDNTCLRILEKKLRRCMYQVTSCSQAKVALNLLREKKGCFDLVLSDVHMPDMDGFKLLELVGLEMDLPVIMISADGRTDLVLRGIRHGACDYLIKPIRDEELKNIWQHVVRKRWVENKKHDPSSNVEDHERLKRTVDDGVCDSSVSEGADEAHKSKKKKRNSKDGDDAELENDDPNGSKKPRVVWSVELHQQFVTAVHQLGIEKAVPKRILELMNVPGLTRENVASHLQKFRLYLKRVSGMSHQGVLPSFCAVEENLKPASLERLDIHALAASGQLPAQTLAALQTELMSRSSSNMMLLPNDPRTPPNASGICGSSCISADLNVAYGRPLIKCSSNISGQSCQPFLGTNTEFSDCAAKNLCDVASAANLVTANENSYALMGFMQEPQPNLKHCMMMEAAPHSVNVQPSCLVVPSLSSPYFQDGNGPDSLGQCCTSIDQSNGSIQLSKSPFVVPTGDAASSGFFTASPLNQLASLPWRIEDPKMLNMNCEFSSYNHEMNAVPGSSMNPLNPDKRSSLPSRFAMDDVSQVNEITPYRVKQEPVADSTGNVRVGIPVRMRLPSNISMRILSD